MEGGCLPGTQTGFCFSPVKCNEIQRLVAKNASHLKRPRWEGALSPHHRLSALQRGDHMVTLLIQGSAWEGIPWGAAPLSLKSANPL